MRPPARPHLGAGTCCRSTMDRSGVLAAEPPPANAHIREEQDDKDNRQDDVHHHWPPVLSETKPSCAVSSCFARMSPPVGWVRDERSGSTLRRKGLLDRLSHDVARCGVLRADSVTEDERREPGHVFDLDFLAALRRCARFRTGEEVPRSAWARAEFDALRGARLPNNADAEAGHLLGHVHLVDHLLGDEERALPKEGRYVAEHVRNHAAVWERERAQLAVLIAVLE